MNFIIRAKVLFIFIIVISPNAFSEEIITKCGSSYGHDFWIENKVFKKGGWEKSSLPDGKILLSKKNDKFILKFKDQSGKLKSVQQLGGKIIPLENNKGNITLLVSYSGNVEIYSFTLNSQGKGELVWTKVRFSIFRNAGVASSKCG